MKISNYFGCKKLLLLCFVILSLSGFAQVEGTHFTYTLANATNPGPNILEFDVNLVVNHTGTALSDGGVKVAGLQFGVNFNPLIMNGGSPSTEPNGGSFSLIPGTRDAVFNDLNFGGANGSGSYRGIVNGFGQLRVVGTTVSGAASVLVPNGTYRIGRYRFTNTVTWIANSDAMLWINNSTTGGSTAPFVTGFKNGTTTPSYPYSLTYPADSPGVSVGYTEGSPLSLILNAPAAPVPGVSFVYTLANPSNPSPTTLEFDAILVVNHTGTALADGGIKIGALQYGVNFDPIIMNGGTPTTAPNGGSFDLVPGTRDAVFNGLDFSGANGSGTYRGTVNSVGQLRVIGTLISGTAAVLVPNGTYRIGRYSFTNNVPWTANSDAQFWINNATAGGSTVPFVTGYKNGTTFSSFPYGLSTPAATPGVAAGYTDVSPLPFLLNVCFTSGEANNLGDVSCFGEADGSATITVDPIPSNLSVNYSVDGGVSSAVVLTAGGAFDVSGLSVGSHTITVTGNSPCTTPVDVILTISGPVSQPTNITTLTECDNYTWDVNNVNYTVSGTYTGTSTDVNGCPVDETLELTITPLVTPDFEAIAPICSGDPLDELPTTSDNGITGSWSPALDNTATAEYTFTPDAPQCATTTTLTITVNPILSASVSIDATATTICDGDSVTFTATPTNGGTPAYQWQLNGDDLLGETASTFTTTALADNDSVTVMMTSDATPCLAGSPATSDAIEMTVNPILVASVSIEATASTICAGDSVTFTALPTNGGTPTYQWQVNGADVLDETASTFTSTTLSDDDSITVIMTSDATPCLTGSPATSNAVNMIVNPTIEASVSIIATDTTICDGDSVTFTATPVNGGTPTYQWQVNGADVLDETASTFTSAGLSDDDSITVIMTSDATPCLNGSLATSNAVNMTVNPILEAGVSINTTATTICSGSSVTFTATPTNGGTPAYQWQVNGADAIGETASTFTTSALSDDDSITVIMTSNASPCLIGSPVTSNTIDITVDPLSVGGSVTGGATICSGQTSGLLTLSGHAGSIIRWESSTNNFVNITNIANTSATYTSGPLTQTTQFRAVVQSGVCAPANSAATTVTISSGPLPAGTYNVPGCFATVSAAISRINTNGITGPVVFAVAAGHTETAPAGGFAITATGTAANTITFIKDGSGANPTFTAPTQASGNINDAIFKIIGGDYITLDGFTMLENPANNTTTAGSNNMTEFGVAMLYASATDGPTNVTIKNCTIDLNRTYQNTFGIYSNMTHTATAVTTNVASATASNSNMVIQGNTITDVNMGVVVIGATPAAAQSEGITIGGELGLGNTITNYGTTGTFSGFANVSGTVNGILVRNTKNFTVSNNTITSSEGGTTVGTLRGIYVPTFPNAPTGTIVNKINNNVISCRSGLASGAIFGILVEGTTSSATTTMNINSNDFNTFGHTVAGTGAITFLSNVSGAIVNVNDNTFTNMSVNTTGGVTFISNSVSVPAAGSKIVNGNSIVGTFAKTGAGGTVALYSDAASALSTVAVQNNNNNFSNITLTGATTMTGWFNNDGTAATPPKQMTGNTFSNWTCGSGTIIVLQSNFGGDLTLSNNTISNITGASTITGILQGSSGTITNSIHSGNTITGLASTGGSVTGLSATHASTNTNISANVVRTLSSVTASVTGMSQSGSAATANIFRNSISDLVGNASGSVSTGLTISAGTTVTAHNNLIGDLRAPNANSANALLGINISGGTTVNAFYNTVYLEGSSVGALFGSSAIFASTTPNLTLRNNIFVNNSDTNATGIAVAYRRSGTVLTSYNNASNNNLFRGSAIFSDGTNTDVTMAAYKGRVAARDAASITENPPFLSISGASPDFLHIDPSQATGIESAGIPVATVTMDYDGDARNATTPDIGADEGTFTMFPAPEIASLSETSGCVGSTLVITGTNLSSVSSATIGGTNAVVTNTTATTVTLTVGSGTTGTVNVVSPSGDATSAETFTVLQAPAITVQPAPAEACENAGIATISVTAPDAITFQWRRNGVQLIDGAPFSGTDTATLTITNPDASQSGSSYDVIVSNGCDTTSDAVTLSINPVPGAVSVTPLDPAVRCTEDAALLLTASGGTIGNVVTSGTGASTTAGNTINANLGPNPLQNYYGGTKQQWIYTAAELTTLGVPAGVPIKAIAINLVTANTALALQSLTVKMKNSATTSFATTSSWESGMSTVRNAAPYTPVLNLNTISLDSPFVWNGTGNLVVEITYSNNNGGETGSSFNTAKYSPTSFVSSIFYRVDSVSAAVVSAFTGAANFTYSARTDMTFDTSVPTTITWTPVDGLYTDAGATNAYVENTPSATVYAKPGTTTIYTATSKSGAGCTNDGSTTITIDPASVGGTVASGQSICSGTMPSDLTLTDNTGNVVKWQSSSDAAFTSPVDIVNNTTTLSGAEIGTLTADTWFRAVVQSGSCAVANSDSVEITINPELPASVSINATATSICSGDSVTFTATPTNGGTPFYQWQVNGADALGETGSTFTSSSLSDDDSVTVIMTSDATPCLTGSPAASNAIEMTVSPIVNASVSIIASETEICSGESVTFTATPVNGGTPTYQWQVNGIDAVGETDSTFTSLSLSDNDSVTVIMTSDMTPCLSGSPATSNAIDMTVNPALAASVSISATATSICSGDSVTFTATPTNGGTPTYQWQVNGIDALGETDSTFTSDLFEDDDSVTVIMTSDASPCLAGSPATSNAVNMTVNVCASIVNLKLFIQGYYDVSGMMKPVMNNQDYESPMTDVEDLTVELYDASTYDLIAASTSTLQTDGTITLIFDTAPSGLFYIGVKGSNLVQTWSAQPQAVGITPLSYDFTTSESQSYTDGSQASVVEVEPGVWAMYSGDVNQDDSVDSFDASSVSNDSDANNFGVLATDLTGDGIVDSFDASLGNNNSDAVIYTQRP